MEELNKLKQKLKRNKDKQKENKKNKKTHFSLTWKALTILVSLLIIYTGYHVLYGLSENVKTTAAGLVEESHSVMLEGVIFRNEEAIKTNNQGDIRPYYADGERVSVDSAVAAIYSQTVGLDINFQIEEIKEKIEIYERSNVQGLVSFVDIEKLQVEIDALYTSLMLAISNNENYKVSQIETELAICLNKMKIYRGELKNFNSEIESLKTTLETLYASFRGEKEYVYADNGGYFYSYCDGYEDVLTYDKLSSLIPNDLKSLTSDVKKNPKKSNPYTCKFVYNSTWKLASVCDETTAAFLELEDEYTITIFDIKERVLKVTLEDIGESQNGQCVLVFSCSTMPEGFDYSRYQSFKLDISSVDGYRVPIQAVTTIVDQQTGEKKTGVYILDGSVVHFRRIDILSEGNGYYIVAKFDKSKENYYEYLNLNDLIILEFEGMYEGKIIAK